MQPRVAHAHPLAKQPVAYITRGPIVYCVEDVDHPWEQDHFKMTILDPTILREETRSQPDQHIAIIAENGCKGELDIPPWNRQIVSIGQIHEQRRDLCFVPYYVRANRGGQGQTRVGLRVEGK